MPREADDFHPGEPSTDKHPRAATGARDQAALHRLTARRFYREAPPYCVQFEDDGSVTLRRKAYEYWEERPPEESTTWEIISRHDDLEEAERRLRLIVSSPVYYDAEGRPAMPPRRSKPRWGMPPTDGE